MLQRPASTGRVAAAAPSVQARAFQRAASATGPRDGCLGGLWHHGPRARALNGPSASLGAQPEGAADSADTAVKHPVRLVTSPSHCYSDVEVWAPMLSARCAALATPRDLASLEAEVAKLEAENDALGTSTGAVGGVAQEAGPTLTVARPPSSPDRPCAGAGPSGLRPQELPCTPRSPDAREAATALLGPRGAYGREGFSSDALRRRPDPEPLRWPASAANSEAGFGTHVTWTSTQRSMTAPRPITPRKAFVAPPPRRSELLSHMSEVERLTQELSNVFGKSATETSGHSWSASSRQPHPSAPLAA